MDFEVKEEGVSEDVLIELVKKTMKYSIHTCERFGHGCHSDLHVVY